MPDVINRLMAWSFCNCEKGDPININPVVQIIFGLRPLALLPGSLSAVPTQPIPVKCTHSPGKWISLAKMRVLPSSTDWNNTNIFASSVHFVSGYPLPESENSSNRLMTGLSCWTVFIFSSLFSRASVFSSVWTVFISLNIKLLMSNVWHSPLTSITAALRLPRYHCHSLLKRKSLAR